MLLQLRTHICLPTGAPHTYGWPYVMFLFVILGPMLPDLDWVVWPGYSSGTFWGKTMKHQPGTMKNQPGTMKNHENRPGTMKNQRGSMKNQEKP